MFIECEVAVATKLYHTSSSDVPQPVPVTAGKEVVAPKVLPCTLLTTSQFCPVFTGTLIALRHSSLDGGEVIQRLNVADCTAVADVV